MSDDLMSNGCSTPQKKRPRKKRLRKFCYKAATRIARRLFSTRLGRKFGYRWIGRFVLNNVEIKDDGQVVITGRDGQVIEDSFSPRNEDYVRTYLIFGLDSSPIGNPNSDAMMLVSLNTRENKIRLVSLMRDTYVDIPGWNPNKLNAAYACGTFASATSKEAKSKGSALLTKTIENNFDVKIAGYCGVNFKSFEKIVDRLGGIDIQLGAIEASYLCSTNYISDPAKRNVVEGRNHLDGNQTVGYCRVRKVPTGDGVFADYGRTVRLRRVITALFDKCKSAGIAELFSAMKDCLGYVFTNLSKEQIGEALSSVMENGFTIADFLRLPADGLYADSGIQGIHNGSKLVTFALVMGEHKKDNVTLLHDFLFGEGQGEESGAANRE